MTALHCTLQGRVYPSGVVHEKIFEWLLEVFPMACELSNADGSYPLHSGCHGHALDTTNLRKLINAYPTPTEKRGFRLTPYRCSFGVVIECEKMTFTAAGPQNCSLLNACPWAASFDDERQLVISQGVDPSGDDALDFMCVKYCEGLGVNAHETVPDDADWSLDSTTHLSGRIH